MGPSPMEVSEKIKTYSKNEVLRIVKKNYIGKLVSFANSNGFSFPEFICDEVDGTNLFTGCYFLDKADFTLSTDIVVQHPNKKELKHILAENLFSKLERRDLLSMEEEEKLRNYVWELDEFCKGNGPFMPAYSKREVIVGKKVYYESSVSLEYRGKDISSASSLFISLEKAKQQAARRVYVEIMKKFYDKI